MADNPSGLPKSWLQKVVNFHIKSGGLGDDYLLSKHFHKIHYAMFLPVLVTGCQEFTGLFMRLKQGQFNLDKIVMHLEYGIIMCVVLMAIYTLAYNRSKTAECIRNATEKLHLDSEMEKALMWQKHLPLFRFLILSFSKSCYLIVVLTSIVYPAMRFTFQREEISYVVFPNWYPVNVVSSRYWFWVVFLYEFVVYWYSAHIILGMCIIFLYVEMATHVRFEALGHYFQQILSRTYRASNRSGELKIAFISTKANRSNAMFKCGAIANVEINENLNIEKLIRGIEDWNILRRQAKLINNTFVVFMSACHVGASLTNVAMAFATTLELQNFQEETLKVITGCIMYLSHVFSATTFMYIVSYYVTLLQESVIVAFHSIFVLLWLFNVKVQSFEHNEFLNIRRTRIKNDNLRASLWKSSWAAENTKTNKLLFHYNTALNQSLTMKLYSFYPINLRTFTQDLSRLRAYFLFLYQLSVSNNKIILF